MKLTETRKGQLAFAFFVQGCEDTISEILDKRTAEDFVIGAMDIHSRLPPELGASKEECLALFREILIGMGNIELYDSAVEEYLRKSAPPSMTV